MPKVDLLEFFDGVQTITIQLRDGVRGLRENPSTPSTLGATGGGQKFGDFDPSFSHLEQRTWVGGRGRENWSDDQTMYYDSQALWGLTEDKLFPAPLYNFAEGLRTTDDNLVDDKSWKKLINAQRFISVSTGAITADKDYLWVRRRGTPGTLTLELRANSAGDADGSVYKTVTKSTTDITDTISIFQVFDWASTQAMSSGDHIVLYGASTDTESDCWEVAVDADGAGSKTATTGSGDWAAAAFSMLYRLTDADTKRKFLFFELEGATYAVSVNDDGSASKLYINGGRGTASAGAATTLTDSGIAWTADRWINAWVKIIAGTGKGQLRQITDNTTEVLTVATWDINPDNTSRYVIIKTPWWTELSTTGLGTVKSVAVLNNIAYFAQGQSDNIRRMYDNAGTHTYADDSTNKADLLIAFPNAADGPQMWNINNTTVSATRADGDSWGNNLDFTGVSAMSIGDKSFPVTNAIVYDSRLYVAKEDDIYYEEDDKFYPQGLGLNSRPGKETGLAMVTQGLFLYFSWWRSFERLYGSTQDDVGPWRGVGLPSTRRGTISSLASLPPMILVGVDAHTGTSSMLAFQDEKYHELFRGYEAGHRLRNIYVQAIDNEAGNSRVWLSYNGELLYMDVSLDPLKDSSMLYMHEAVCESPVFDMGHAETYKFFKEIDFTSENLTNTINLEVDYQKGSDCNTSSWTYANTVYENDGTVTLDVGETKRLKYRMRMQTDDASTPPLVNAIVVKGYEVTPVKRLWNVSVKTSTRVSGNITPADTLYDWLWDVCQKAKKVEMKTSFPGIGSSGENGVVVKIEPPVTLWTRLNETKDWTGEFQLVIREQ
ncbi:MAG: hypothetical protein KKD77_24630 [Gammaproteobacteria bacterium]|nr:hypothetical protein [Gammaproteobacteria bacterium]